MQTALLEKVTGSRPLHAMGKVLASRTTSNLLFLRIKEGHYTDAAKLSRKRPPAQLLAPECINPSSRQMKGTVMIKIENVLRQWNRKLSQSSVAHSILEKIEL